MFWFKKRRETSQASASEAERSCTECCRFSNETERTLYLWIEVECVGVDVPPGATAEVYFDLTPPYLPHQIDYTEEGWTFWCNDYVSKLLVDGEEVMP